MINSRWENGNISYKEYRKMAKEFILELTEEYKKKIVTLEKELESAVEGQQTLAALLTKAWDELGVEKRGNKAKTIKGLREEFEKRLKACVIPYNIKTKKHLYIGATLSYRKQNNEYSISAHLPSEKRGRKKNGK